MKVGSKAASPLGKLQETILCHSTEYFTDDEISRADAQPLASGESYMFWTGVHREVSSRKGVYGSADSNRVERELIERFGSFKMLLTHPYSQRFLLCAEGLMKGHLVGDPILPKHTSVVLLFMAYKGQAPAIKCIVLACLLFTVHPVLVIVGLAVLSSLAAHKCARKRPRAEKAPAAGIQDVLIYGGGLRGLYTAALIARAGLRVAVLVPESRCEGDAISRPRGAPCDFALDRCELGQISQYEALLSPCFHVSKPVCFEPVGSAHVGWAHGILITGDLCRPIPLRSGLQAWVDDVSLACGADRGVLRTALTHAVAVFGEMFSFIVAKSPDNTSFFWKLTSDMTRNESELFKTAANMTAVDAAGPALPMARVFAQACSIGGLLREEHISPNKASFAAWSASAAHGVDGYYIPKGGISHICASLQATITACGGQILTNTAIQTIGVASCADSLVSVSAVGDNRKAVYFTAEKVVLAVDAAACLDLIRETNAHSELSLPWAQPVVRTLIAFAGTCERLDIPQAVPIFWRNHGVCDTLNNTDWKTITLRNAPDNVVACVVEGSMNYQETDVLNIIAQLFPLTKGKVLYVNSLAPTVCGLSHTPARYAAESSVLRPKIEGLNGVFLALDDFALSNAAGSVVAGYLAAHAILGSSNDMFEDGLAGLFTA